MGHAHPIYDVGYGIRDFELRIPNCELRIADCELRIADSGIADRELLCGSEALDL